MRRTDTALPDRVPERRIWKIVWRNITLGSQWMDLMYMQIYFALYLVVFVLHM